MEELERAVLCAYDETADNSIKQQALEYCENFLNSTPQYWYQCLSQVCQDSNDVFKFWCLNSVAHFVEKEYSNSNEEDKKQFRETILQFIREIFPSAEFSVAIRNKFCQIVVSLLRECFPDEWPTFFQDLLSLLNEGIGVVDLFLRILNTIEVDIVSKYVEKSESEHDAGTRLKDAMREYAIQDIVTAWQQLLTGLYESHPDVCAQCLAVIKNYIDWIDIHLITTDDLMKFYFYALSIPALRNEACGVLYMMVNKGMEGTSKVKMLHQLGIIDVLVSLNINELNREIIKINNNNNNNNNTNNINNNNNDNNNINNNKNIDVEPFLDNLARLLSVTGEQLVSARDVEGAWREGVLVLLPVTVNLVEMCPINYVVRQTIPFFQVFLKAVQQYYKQYQQDQHNNELAAWIQEIRSYLTDLVIPALFRRSGIPVRLHHSLSLLSSLSSSPNIDSNHSHNINNSGITFESSLAGGDVSITLEDNLLELRKELFMILRRIAQVDGAIVKQFTQQKLMEALTLSGETSNGDGPNSSEVLWDGSSDYDGWTAFERILSLFYEVTEPLKEDAFRSSDDMFPEAMARILQHRCIITHPSQYPSVPLILDQVQMGSAPQNNPIEENGPVYCKPWDHPSPLISMVFFDILARFPPLLVQLPSILSSLSVELSTPRSSSLSNDASPSLNLNGQPSSMAFDAAWTCIIAVRHLIYGLQYHPAIATILSSISPSTTTTTNTATNSSPSPMISSPSFTAAISIGFAASLHRAATALVKQSRTARSALSEHSHAIVEGLLPALQLWDGSSASSSPSLSSPRHLSSICFTDRELLYEAIGAVITQDSEAAAVIEPLLETVRTIIDQGLYQQDTAAQPVYATVLGQHITALGTFTKVLSPSVLSQPTTVFHSITDVVLRVFNALPNNAIIRGRTLFYLHRVIEMLGKDVLSFIGPILQSLLNTSQNNPSDLQELINVCAQLVMRLGNSPGNADVIDVLFSDIARSVLTMASQVPGGSEMSPDPVSEEGRQLNQVIRTWLGFLRGLFVHGCSQVYGSGKNADMLDNVTSAVVAAGRNTVSPEVAREGIAVARYMTEHWAGQVSGFDAFAMDTVAPLAFQPLTTMDPQDAGSVKVVREAVQLQVSLAQRYGGEELARHVGQHIWPSLGLGKGEEQMTAYLGLLRRQPGPDYRELKALAQEVMRRYRQQPGY